MTPEIISMAPTLSPVFGDFGPYLGISDPQFGDFGP